MCIIRRQYKRDDDDGDGFKEEIYIIYIEYQGNPCMPTVGPRLYIHVVY